MKWGERWRALIRRGKGGQFRRRGREEDKIALRMLERAIRNLTTFYLPKTTYNTIRVCIYLYITKEPSFISLDLTF